jgi:HAD superfamily phosphoserine phosphatase-like hydrolase
VREVLADEASLVRCTYDEGAALLRREVRLDPSFPAFVAACRARDIPLTVVSSGLEPIIRDRLEELGVRDVAIVANGLDPDPRGWRILWRDESPNGTDKAALVLTAAATGARTIFIGDGRSDYEAATAADVRLAKRGLQLERYLTRHGVPFEPFSTFAEIVLASLSEAP